MGIEAPNTKSILPSPERQGLTNWDVIMIGGAAALAALLSLLIEFGDLNYNSGITGRVYEWLDNFRVFGAGAAALLCTLWWRRSNSQIQSLIIGLSALIALNATTTIYRQTWDYMCYENAARLVYGGLNPYSYGCYIYPPLMAEALALVVQFQVSSLGLQEQLAWDITFYLYAVLQWFALTSCILVLFELVDSRLRSTIALFAIAICLALAVPTIRGLENLQVNLLVLFALCIAMRFYKSHPLLVAFALALAIHIKLYPALLLIPFLIYREGKVVVFTSFLVLAIASVDLYLNGLNHYLSFLRLIAEAPMATGPVNQTFSSVIHNFSFGTISGEPLRVIQLSFAAGAILLLSLWLWKQRVNNDIILALAVTAAVGLLISPLTYVHHYVLAIPLVILFILRSNFSTTALISGTILLFIPENDLFPFSYFRIVTLSVALYLLLSGKIRLNPLDTRSPS